METLEFSKRGKLTFHPCLTYPWISGSKYIFLDIDDDEVVKNADDNSKNQSKHP